MKMFDFDPAEYLEQYRRQGWVHIREGVTAEFHQYLTEYRESSFSEQQLEKFAIRGKKDQALFEFPSGVDCVGELFDTIGRLCDLDRDRMVLSERHIQEYEANALAEPVPHKDRYPSQVSVGLSIRIPAGSKLVLYPADHIEINPFNKAADLNRHLQPDEQPQVVLADTDAVEIEDHERDVVAFAGSRTWHLRRRSAGAVNVYFKVNDFGCDPLGEDGRTPERRAQTLAGLQQAPGGTDALVPELSRRLDTVARVCTRNSWQEALQLRLYDEEPVGITESQWAALRRVDGRLTLAELTAQPASAAERDRARQDLVRLAELGAVDLVRARR